LVEPAELFRVFPPAEAVPQGVPDHAQADAELRIRLQVAEERLGELKQMIAELGVRHERETTDLRAQRDSWQQQAERLALPAQGRASSVPEYARLKLVRRRVRALGLPKTWWGLWAQGRVGRPVATGREDSMNLATHLLLVGILAVLIVTFSFF
jgi:hypothetical protein